MKNARYILVIIFIGFLSASELLSSKWTSYHGFEGKCLDCHLSVPTDAGEPGTLKKDITLMCVGCHKEAEQLSHPVDVRPSMAVPAKFPLDWKGDITCVTCHPAHQEGFGDFHLRSRASGEGFCVTCHFDMEKDIHRVSVGSAHVGRGTGTKFIPDQLGVVLDELSLRCLACHDAVFGSEAAVENRAGPPGFHKTADLGLSHPIGVSYIEARRNYKGAYRSMDKLPQQIKLFGGIVGCGSCHNPYSKQHFELVMSNEGSALCLSCHVK